MALKVSNVIYGLMKMGFKIQDLPDNVVQNMVKGEILIGFANEFTHFLAMNLVLPHMNEQEVANSVYS